MKLKPLHDRVVVERSPVERMSQGGIHIPEFGTEKPATGTVTATGSSKELSIGDKVLFGKYAGVEVDIKNKPLLVLREEEIIAVIYE